MYILAIDCGTQSLRGIVFDHQGTLLIKEKISFSPYKVSQPGYAEQDSLVFYKAMCTAINRLNKNEPEVMKLVAGITVTTQRDAVICVNEEGEPLRPAIIWADQRRIDQPRPMSLLHTAIFRLVGMAMTAENLSRNFKGHWIQDNEPEIWAKTYKYLQLSAYLNYKLTGLFKDGMASQIGHVPFSYKNFRLEHPRSLKHDIFHIDNSKFCEFVAAGDVLGHLTEGAALDTGLEAGLKVIASGSDKGCETLGVGCMDNSTLSISLGSQASIQTTTKKYYETLALIPPFQSVMPGYYNPEIQVYRGYWMISWFLKEFAQKEVVLSKELGVDPVSLLNAALDKVPVGSEGLFLQPYWGAGVKKNEARGSIIGFNDAHTRIHIYRAIIEGIGFTLYEGMKQIERRSGCQIEKIMISGGGSNSDAICQITADIFNLPVYRVQTYETSALGASIAGYIGLGIHSTYQEAVTAMVHPSRPFQPITAHHQTYHKMYKHIYKKIYKKLRPLYRKFKDLAL